MQSFFLSPNDIERRERAKRPASMQIPTSHDIAFFCVILFSHFALSLSSSLRDKRSKNFFPSLVSFCMRKGLFFSKPWIQKRNVFLWLVRFTKTSYLVSAAHCCKSFPGNQRSPLIFLGRKKKSLGTKEVEGKCMALGSLWVFS